MYHEKGESISAISKSELLMHLRLSNSSSGLLETTGLQPIAGKYPWSRIWRSIHKVDGNRFEDHLSTLRARNPGSHLLSQISDLEHALRVPLWDFPKIAQEMGWRYDAWRKAVKEGRAELPAPGLRLGERKFLFRPFEVRLMRDENIRLSLPPAADSLSPNERAGARKNEDDGNWEPSDPASASGKSTLEGLTTRGDAKSTIFGTFTGPKRPP